MSNEELSKVFIYRYETSKHGTLGYLTHNDMFNASTIELPWKDNKPNISCIPNGDYVVTPHRYRRRYKSFRLLDVPNRSSVLLHHGNFAGDAFLGYKTHSAGCIILGKRIGYLGRQKAVLLSRLTVSKFVEHMNFRPFLLCIREMMKITNNKNTY